jgi:hypothetical protein
MNTFWLFHEPTMVARFMQFQPRLAAWTRENWPPVRKRRAAVH